MRPVGVADNAGEAETITYLCDVNEIARVNARAVIQLMEIENALTRLIAPDCR
jgi:hypothetical protein